MRSAGTPQCQLFHGVGAGVVQSSAGAVGTPGGSPSIPQVPEISCVSVQEIGGHEACIFGGAVSARTEIRMSLCSSHHHSNVQNPSRDAYGRKRIDAC